MRLVPLQMQVSDGFSLCHFECPYKVLLQVQHYSGIKRMDPHYTTLVTKSQPDITSEFQSFHLQAKKKSQIILLLTFM